MMQGNNNNEKVILYEDSAEFSQTISGWICMNCRRYWGDNDQSEHLAKFCCANDSPCRTDGCNNRVLKGWSNCETCQLKASEKRWLDRPEKDWDGETPLCDEGTDKYFFDPSGLDEYLYDENLSLENLRLAICEPKNGPRFYMYDFLSDSLPDDDDGHIDTTNIDKQVNDWIEKHAPFSWYPSKYRATLSSMREACNPQQAHVNGG